jgi:hypothetical protein
MEQNRTSCDCPAYDLHFDSMNAFGSPVAEASSHHLDRHNDRITRTAQHSNNASPNLPGTFIETSVESAAETPRSALFRPRAELPLCPASRFSICMQAARRRKNKLLVGDRLRRVQKSVQRLRLIKPSRRITFAVSARDPRVSANEAQTSLARISPPPQPPPPPQYDVPGARGHSPRARHGYTFYGRRNLPPKPAPLICCLIGLSIVMGHTPRAQPTSSIGRRGATPRLFAIRRKSSPISAPRGCKCARIVVQSPADRPTDACTTK